MLLSVIIPTFNCTERIEKIVESIASIAMCKKEIIIIDDGSVDASKNFLKTVEKKNKQVKIIFNNHNGVGASRNMGMLTAQGDYITFIDDDDRIYPEAYSKMIEQAKLRPSLDVISTSINVSNDHDMVIYSGKNMLKNMILSVLQVNTKSLKTSEYPSGPCAKLFKRKILIENKILFPTDIFNGEDLIFNCHVLLHSKEVQLLKNKVYEYIQNRDSLMHHYFPNMKLNNALFENYILEVVNLLDGLDYKERRLICEYWNVRLAMTNILRQDSVKTNYKDDFLSDIRTIKKDLMDPELGKILNYNFTKDQIIFIKIIMTFPNNIIIPSVKILKCLKHFKISLSSSSVQV
ncbi:glycosyltransferase family 2 protein [Lactiplantibacillus plantarum]|uniref:glycosyltransferase family 2 protein n=1 Tax=Lactiplantibacillus plantarum TaxID=1590 RepID=UPI0022B9A925|nr:glycosyltransferase family 2 protein [Lactiplantibacillus plantarum]